MAHITLQVVPNDDLNESSLDNYYPKDDDYPLPKRKHKTTFKSTRLTSQQPKRISKVVGSNVKLKCKPKGKE